MIKKSVGYINNNNWRRTVIKNLFQTLDLEKKSLFFNYINFNSKEIVLYTSMMLKSGSNFLFVILSKNLKFSFLSPLSNRFFYSPNFSYFYNNKI